MTTFLAFMKRNPRDLEVSAALATMSPSGSAVSVPNRVNVRAVPGSSRAVYHIIVARDEVADVSRILTKVLNRPFSAGYSGWFINSAEARALLKAARRGSRY